MDALRWTPGNTLESTQLGSGEEDTELLTIFFDSGDLSASEAVGAVEAVADLPEAFLVEAGGLFRFLQLSTV